MKFVLIAFACLFTLSAQAGNLTFTQATMTVDSKDGLGMNYLASTVEKWCLGFNSGVSFASFEAAQVAENLADGFYVCDGKFLTAPYESHVQIFELTRCALTNPAAFKSTCK